MPDIYDELGVRPVLNAQGNRTLLGGSTPSPAVRELMDAMGVYYVDLGELMDSVAVKISDIVSNQQKWDTLGAERSGAGWRSGELPEGPVVASSPFGGLSLHLLPAL